MTPKRKRSRWLKLLAIVSLLCVAGGIWQAVMIKMELRTYLPEGQTYLVNGHNMHLYGAGEGEGTVVFITGSGTPNAYTDFYALMNELQPYARTVTFDHAGFGWSETTSIPRDFHTVSNELHELLQTAGEQAPYLLVAHSLASLEALSFAQQYPDEVKGIVLLDGGSPEFYAKESEWKAYALNRFFAGMRVTGFARALGAAGILLPFYGENIRYKGLPEEVKGVDVAMYYSHIGSSSNISVLKHINENAQAVMEGGYLKGIPLLILSSDSGGSWEGVQKQLLNWSDESRQETLPRSSHYIHWSNQKTVISKIVEMLSH
ncbi:alpha/beta fold hydrolase [Paenibacillus oryzae]|nr:alpha/beta hydrolase [Paenibacillus oryzae]